MDEMKERCILNESLISKYKFPSPATSSTSTSQGPSTSRVDSVKKALFKKKEISSPPQFNAPSTTTSSPEPYLTELKNTPFEEPEKATVNEKALLKVFEQMEAEDYSTRQAEEAVDNPDDIIGRQELPADSEDNQDSIVRGQEVSVEEENIELQREEQLPKKTAEKKYYCPFCRQLYYKFARHLFQVHSGEEEIKKIAELPPKSDERAKVIAKLRAEGSRIYNTLQSSPSKIIIPRHKKDVKREHYIECYMCGNLYKSYYLYKHIKSCPSAEGIPLSNPLRTAKMQSYKSPEDDSALNIQFSRDVLSGIREGEIKQVIATDPVLKEYGTFMCCLYGNDTHLINLIRRKLRQVAEVLIEMRKLDKEIVHLIEVFNTTKKSTLFQAIKNVTGFENGTFKRPAMANEMSTILQHCARRLISKLLEMNETEKVNEVKRWIELIKADYNALISKHARRDLDENKWNKPKTLPLSEDLIKLNLFVKQTAESAIKTLKEGFDYPQWENLNKATMVKILIFNRKRVGDVQRIRIEDFKKAHNVQSDTITYQLLSESERITCQKYMRVEVRGKHAKVVPMLITKDVLESLNFIVSLREQAGIPQTNPFLFAHKDNVPFQAAATLRYFAYNCGAMSPKFLTGTKLRQQIATATQAFNFSENDLSLLANYLGHTLQTHRDFYRLPDEAIQLAKISKVLEIVDSGKAADLKGKSLTELENYVTTMIEETSVEGQEEHLGGIPRIELPKRKETGTPKKTRVVVRRTWTTPEKHVMRTYFKHHLTNGTLPTPDECKDAKFKYSPLRQRTVEQIKAWVNNYNKKTFRLKSRSK